MKRIDNREIIRRRAWELHLEKDDRGHVSLRDKMPPFHVEDNGNDAESKFDDGSFMSDMGPTCLDYDEEFVVQCPMMPTHVDLGKQQLDSLCPAVLRDRKTLDFVGYLPLQCAFLSQFYNNSTDHCKYLLTVSGVDQKVYSTRVESNLIRSQSELEVKVPSQVKRKEIYDVGENIICAHFHRQWFACGKAASIQLCKIEDSAVSLEFDDIKLAVCSEILVPPGSELVDCFMDSVLDIIVIVLNSANFLVYKDLSSPQLIQELDCEQEMWGDWTRPKEKRKVVTCVKDGFLSMVLNSGKIFVYRWNGESFDKWGYTCDASYGEMLKRGTDPHYLSPSCDIQCGFMMTVDASGVRFLIWDLLEAQTGLDVSTEANKHDQQQPQWQPLITVKEVKRALQIGQVTATVFGFTMWSQDGDCLLVTLDSGLLFEINLVKGQDVPRPPLPPAALASLFINAD
eukprot:TRINITY_DN5441_c0_g1_i1.p1 TRINITY_DN5441_c0_g1~~TRINITY_DN5441_c0_g1_i1.p1  ORF type:complete len:492 (-),score=107.67 TRINITY_DN5441_c0_g1_i1:78-1442(-)